MLRHSISPVEVEICILAGGLSSRMGRDKSKLVLGGKPILDHVLAGANELGCPVRVIRKDRVPRSGPLGGVATGLATAKRPFVLFLACDMPFVSAKLLLHFLDACTPSNSGAFVQANGQAGFPFLLRSSTGPVVQRQLDRGQFSINALAQVLGADKVPLPRVYRGDLLNVNSPSDWEKARQLWRKRDGAAMDGNILIVKGLSVRRGQVMILNEVSWSVGAGEHWVILGPNGCGKTSLLSALTGYLTPSSGSIDLLGQRYGRNDWRELRTRVGIVSSSIRQMMPEPETALTTVVSGKYAIIDLWRDPTSAELKQARRILREIHCGDLSERPWSFLSQGERQRILIGRALMARPRVLILDEPCAGLDPVSRDRFLRFLSDLGRKPDAPVLVLVTHHVEEVTPTFTHALLVKGGRVLASGPRKRVLTSKNLSLLFDCQARITKGKDERYHLQFALREEGIL